MFKPAPSKFNPILIEEQILNFWKLRRIFTKSSDLRQGSAEFVTYEGLRTASGKPTIQHALTCAFEDVCARYKRMRGYHIIRRGGWEAHNPFIEMGIENQLGFTHKDQIEAYGIERFNALCRKSAFKFIQDWERFYDRVAFWLDMQDAYVTYTNDYIESLWWILKTLWDRGLLYQGYKVVPYCSRCGTPLSEHEVALGCADTMDLSIFIRMPLVDEPGTSLLVWTAAPWTLTGNVAVAANPEAEYVTVRVGLAEGGSEKLILERACLDKIFGDKPTAVVDSFKGKKLKGKRYHPLFTFLRPDKPAYYVILQDHVAADEGTGLIHIAPAFDAQGFSAAIENDLPILMTVTDNGAFIPQIRPWSGQFFKDAEPTIVEDLEKRGLLFQTGSYARKYPFCWRCDTPLMDIARSAWYLRTCSSKERMIRLNQQINWIPGAIKNGRFSNWLEHTADWVISRERYWGAPLPIWECDACHHQIVVGSLDELSRLAGRDLTSLDLHRPAIDQIRLSCPECGAEMTRTPDVIDIWLDSGAMPVAQWHFPYENRSVFRAQFPADYVCETLDQTSGWFYSLHAISALLFDSAAFKNALCLGPILDGDERVSLIEPGDVLNIFGADALRWLLYTNSPPGQESHFSPNQLEQVIHNFSLPLWQTYTTLIACANLDRWTPRSLPTQAADYETHPLDHWLRSELHSLTASVTQALEEYDLNSAACQIQRFVQALSNWYLRRSRRRLWSAGEEHLNEVTADKAYAYATLFEALVTLSKLLAPVMPFLAEAIYQNLARSFDPSANELVHLCDWPGFDPKAVDEALNEDMRLVMQLAALAHTARRQAGVKATQPIQQVCFVIAQEQANSSIVRFSDLLADELNAKNVQWFTSADELIPGLQIAAEGAYLAAISVERTPELDQEGLARVFIEIIQNLRTQAELDIADRIQIYFSTTPDLAQAVQIHQEMILFETLGLDLQQNELPEGIVSIETWFDGQWLKAGIQPA